MKRILFVLSMMIALQCFSQDSLVYFNTKRHQTTLTGMKILGGWGIANLGAGIIGMANSDGSNKYFYQMSAIWGGINLGIATLGYISNKKKMQESLDAAQSLQAQNRIEKLFLINGCLDLAYIGTGIYLNSSGNNRDDVKLKGYGSSFVMQGVFLLAFDAAMYSAERTNGNKLRCFLNKNAVEFDGRSIGIVHNF